MPNNNSEINVTDELSILTKKNTELEEQINRLNEKNAKLDEKINKLIKEVDMQDKTLASYRKEFQTIFFDHELKPIGILKHFQDIGTEMIKFVDYVCEKYDLEYWLDYGTLIGAVRHGGYIPFDDDLDLGMMRKDFNKFIKVFDNEIMRFDLENNLKWSVDIVISDIWVQSFIKIYYFDSKGHALGGLDIFPYDFIIENKDNTEQLYYEEELYFHKKIMDGKTRAQAENDYYEKLGMDYNHGEIIVPGVDAGTGNGPGETRYHYHQYDDLFPLNKIKFNETYFKCPNDSDDYLKSIYGDYWHLPRIIHAHDVIERMHKIPDLEDEYLKELRKIQYINNNFE